MEEFLSFQVSGGFGGYLGALEEGGASVTLLTLLSFGISLWAAENLGWTIIFAKARYTPQKTNPKNPEPSLQ